MKSLFSIALIIVILSLSLGSCRTYLNRLDKRHQMRYFPVEYANIYLGMPLKEAKIVRPAMNLKDATDSLRVQYFEFVGRDKIESTLYFFDKKDTQQLVQLIIEFETVEETSKVVRWLYGKSKEEDGTWRFDSKEDFMIEVQTSGKKITIAKEK